MSPQPKCRAVAAADWIIRENEGGFSNHPEDRGRATKYGVTSAVAAAHGLDVHALTLDQARQILISDYWRFDWVSNDALARKLFDIAVNMGPAWAIRLLQGALNILDGSVTVDGMAGTQTRTATERENPVALLAAIAHLQMGRYEEIVRADPAQGAFLRGWFIRAVKGVQV
jgi:lysozyme family protein